MGQPLPLTGATIDGVCSRLSTAFSCASRSCAGCHFTLPGMSQAHTSTSRYPGRYRRSSVEWLWWTG